ncbi:MAG: hypothetical protein NTV11_15985 [Rhodocyclales bacterium]|nr:hypothetical protein [Rhodocyclales bacterium]
MIATTVKKGKLELLLDEFTEVHGTVLMGMHKELQTLKQEVDKRVEAQIGTVLTKIEAADSVLKSHLESAAELSTIFDGREKRAISAIASVKKDAISDLEATRDAVHSEAALVQSEFSDHRAKLDVLDAEMRKSFEERYQMAVREVGAVQASWEQEAEALRKSLQVVETATRESLEGCLRDALENLNVTRAKWEAQAESIGNTLRDLECTLQGELQATKREAVGVIGDQQRLWNEKAKRSVEEFADLRTALNTLCFELEGKLAEQQRTIAASLNGSASRFHEELSQLRNESVGLIQELLADIKQQRSDLSKADNALQKRQAAFHEDMTRSKGEISLMQLEHQNEVAAFQADIARSMGEIGLMHLEHQSKMAASLRVADKLNSDSQERLKAVSDRAEQIHQREIALQKRTRQIVIGVGLAVILTLGVWVWLTLHH